MASETALEKVPPEEWQVKQVVLLDWHDGPITGLCELEYPKTCFYFDLFAEYRNPQDLDDRLFRVHRLPIQDIEPILSILKPLGQPKGKIWAPIWNFPSANVQGVTEQALDEVLTQREATQLIFRATNMERFLGIWTLV